MTRLVTKLTLSAVFCCGVLFLRAPAAEDESAAVRDVVRQYVDARELRDPQAVSALFGPGADQLVSTGEWRRGVPELVRGMLASSESNSGKRIITVETVRFPAPGVAIADGRYEIAASAPEEKPRQMWTTFVMTKRGGTWRIDAIRNMLPAGQRVSAAPAATAK